MPPTAAALAPMLAEARSLIQRARFDEAATLCERVLRQAPNLAPALALLSTAHHELGNTAESRSAIDRALAAAPTDRDALFQHARLCIRESRFAEAHKVLDTLAAANPGHPAVLGLKGSALTVEGRYDEAFELLRTVAAANPADLASVSAFARASARVKRHADGADALRRALNAANPPPPARADALYLLGELLDAQSRYDDAFAAYREANDTKNALHPPIDPAAQSQAIDQLIAAWSPAAVAALPRLPATDLPLFVVGFWRSGTTLVEQVISAHPEAAGAGELLDITRIAHGLRNPALRSAEPVITDLSRLTRPALESAVRNYLVTLRRVSPRAKRITDKQPSNFVQLGLIRAMFPGTRVIHCTRDPVDTCLSAWFNMPGSIGFGHDLRAIALMYKDYQRLMEHWKTIPDLRILDVPYESFVEDQKAQTRRILDHARLPWDDRCLRFHENARTAMTPSMHQVRRPLYTSSVQRWRNYEKHLGPLLDVLRA